MYHRDCLKMTNMAPLNKLNSCQSINCLRSSRFAIRYSPRRSHVEVIARNAGGPPSFGGGTDPNRRLILPGQDSLASRAPGRIVIPGSDSSAGGPMGSGAGLAIPGEPPQVRNFRPPPGFMDTADATNEDVAGLSVETMMSKLRARSGYWHELAKFIPVLNAQGQTSEMIEEATGLERRLQSIWISAVQVYNSLKQSNEVESDVLAYYDQGESEHLLIELRFLSGKQRIAAVKYIAENALSQQETNILARAIKEQERRSGEKEGFTDSPADCLAYKHFRDALECRSQKAVEVCANKGLAVASSDTAIAALKQLFDGDVVQTVGPTANLTILRLTRDEIAFRPIAIAGKLAELTPAMLTATPKASCEGAFGNFKLSEQGLNYEWIALPAWSAITLAITPVIALVKEISEDESLRDVLAAKSKEDVKRIQGQGLLVMDIGRKIKTPSTEHFYAIAKGDKIGLMGGNVPGIESETILGQVLFLCRPPARDSDSASTSELLQL